VQGLQGVVVGFPILLLSNTIVDMVNIVFSCELADGLGKAIDFTQIDWVRAAFRDHLSIDCYPGTFNLLASNDDAKLNWALVREWKGILLPSPEPGWCASRAWHARIERCIGAAIILPEVDSYPNDKIELIAPVNVRSKLGLRAGDQVKIEVCDGQWPVS
jgi:CTP-dependent riboflavin kinase